MLHWVCLLHIYQDNKANKSIVKLDSVRWITHLKPFLKYAFDRSLFYLCRHKTIRTTCCGTKDYNYSDLQLKCCHGILYNLTVLGWNPQKAQCCGSLLLKERSNSTQECCISSQGRSLAYKAQPGLSCCGHHYYNTSLWSCISESLFPLCSRQRSGLKTGANNHRGQCSISALGLACLVFVVYGL